MHRIGRLHFKGQVRAFGVVEVQADEVQSACVVAAEQAIHDDAGRTRGNLSQ